MNNCKVCGTKKKMHYIEFCPKCYIPEPRDIKAYDLFKMFYHMEDKYEGFKDRFWDFIIDNYDIRNDSFFQFNFYYCDKEDEEEVEDLNLFMEEYGHLLENDKQQSIWLWVSW